MATTTPNYGWDVPTSTDYVKDGATAIETLGDDIDATLYTALGGAYPGLRLIKKQTIGTGVSTVTVTNAFSATYDNYLIMINGGVGSTTAEINMKLGSTATGYYTALLYASFGVNSAQAVTLSNAGYWAYIGAGSTNSLRANCNVLSPFLAKNSQFNSIWLQTDTSGNASGYLNNSTSYTDFTVYPISGTWTGGTIYVYGYGAS
jgi:hypothetical protein